MSTQDSTLTKQMPASTETGKEPLPQVNAIQKEVDNLSAWLRTLPPGGTLTIEDLPVTKKEPLRPTLGDLRMLVRRRPQKFRAALRDNKLNFLTPESMKVILQELGEYPPES